MEIPLFVVSNWPTPRPMPRPPARRPWLATGCRRCADVLATYAPTYAVARCHQESRSVTSAYVAYVLRGRYRSPRARAHARIYTLRTLANVCNVCTRVLSLFAFAP